MGVIWEARRLFAISAGALILVSSLPLAQGLIPPGPTSELTEEEHAEFIQTYLDIFVTGTRDINTTPGMYDYTGELQASLSQDIVQAIKTYNETLAHEFDPAYAGPLLGLSSPDDPLTSFDGEMLTEEHVEDMYGGLIGNLVFRREAFYAELTELANNMFPTNQTEDVDATNVTAEMMRNYVMEDLESRPLLEWDNDIDHPVIPALFTPRQRQTLVGAPPIPAPSNMTAAVHTSPMAAVAPEDWQQPGFHLPLRDLLGFLSGLSGLAVGDILALLRDVAATADAAAEHVRGTIESFPALHSQVQRLDAATSSARAALHPLVAPEGLLGNEVALPPEIDEILALIDDTLAQNVYTASVNGSEPQSAPFGTPTLFDVDDDGVADIIVQVAIARSLGSLGGQPLVATPQATIARAGAEADLNISRIPYTARIGFQAPGNGPTIVYDVGMGAGADQATITLDDPRLALSWAAVGSAGSFSITAASISGDDVLVASANGTLAPVSLSLAVSADADPHGRAQIHARPVGAAALDLAVLREAPSGRLALSATSNATRIDVDSRGIKMRVDLTEGGQIHIDRQEFIGNSVDDSKIRSLSLSNAASTTHADLEDARVTYLANRGGAGVDATVGDLTGTGYESGAWLAIDGAGREFTFEFTPGGIRFGSIVIVPRISVVVATDSVSALTGALTTGIFLLRDDLLAFTLDNVRNAEASRDAGQDLTLNIVTPYPQPFLFDSVEGDDDVRFLFSNLPPTASIDLDAGGLTLGSSTLVSNVIGLMNRSLDGPLADPTQTIAFFESMGGTTAVSMNDASMDLFTTGSLGLADVLGSNEILPNGSFVFDRLDGNHMLAQVEGTLHQYSSMLTDMVGNISGGAFGVYTNVTLDLLIDGPLCQSFGKDDTQIEICFSNIPDHIAIESDVVAGPVGVRVAYNASDLIHRLTIRLQAPDVDMELAILEIPRLIELLVNLQSIDISMSSRLAAILFTAQLGDTTLAAGIEDLPDHVRFEWSTEGLTPTFDPDEYIGRVFLFLSQPDFTFSVDIVYIPLFTLQWGEGAIAFVPSGNRRIGKITVQLLVEQLTLLLEAEGIPGVEVSWDGIGGSLATSAALDRLSVSLTVGSDLSLLATIVDVPPATLSWTDAASDLTLDSGRIGEIKLQFIAGDLLLFADARGVPGLDLARNGDGFQISAPGGIDDLQLILAKGSGYFDPSERTTDFVGLYLRPDNLTVGLSARVRGFEGVTIHKDDITKEQLVTLDFVVDKDIQLIVNVLTSQLVFLADALISDLRAHTTLSFQADGVVMNGTSAGGGVTTPWLQARLYLGTLDAYGELPEPRWPFETEGLTSGIMANTLLDVPNAGFATKWKIYAPLPGDFGFNKQTDEGIPSYGLNVDVELGKLDLRTMLEMDINGVPLHTLAVITVTNLPTGLSVGQGLGNEHTSGNPSFTLTAGAPIDNVFLGIRFDDRWYGRILAEDPEFIDLGLPWVEWEGGADRDLGFPIWLSVGDIPTSVSFSAGKTDWSTDSTPLFNYAASASTIDASLFIDIGILWDTFVKGDFLAAADAGHTIPGWLKGLARYDASGHLIVQIVDVPAQGMIIQKDGKDIAITVPDLPALGCNTEADYDNVPACSPFAWDLGKLYIDFNLRIEEYHGNSGCIICGNVLQLSWYWHYGWGFEIVRLSLMLKDLKYLSLKPGITSDLLLDGELLFDFRASVFFHAGAGVALHLKVLGFRILIFCICLDFEFQFIVAASFITFQIEEHTWKLNYWTWAWPCSWDDWCHKHLYAGVDYTIPGNWRFDLGIYWPPLVDFRGLRLNSAHDGQGIQAYKMFLDPIIMPCITTIAGAHFGPRTPCFGFHLVPVPFYMAYAYLHYFSVSGPNFWSVKHKH